MDNLKRYTKELIMNDTMLSKDIENFMQRTLNTEQHDADVNNALANNQDCVKITDKDFVDYSNFLEVEKESDYES